MNYGGALRAESDLLKAKSLHAAVRREMVKYADPNRHGYPHNLLEQMESFTARLVTCTLLL